MGFLRSIEWSIILVGLLVQVGHEAAVSVNIIDKHLDQNGGANIGQIARIVCDRRASKSDEIGRPSTISKLVNYFDTQVPADGSDLAECKQRLKLALDDLNKVIEASKSNVCDMGKIELIARFHETYISESAARLHPAEKLDFIQTPRILKVFFMHYAIGVDAICRKNLINIIEWDIERGISQHINNLLPSETQKDQPKMISIIQMVVQNVDRLFPEVRDFDDVILVWDLIEETLSKLRRSNNNSEAQYFENHLFSARLEPETKAYVRMQSTEEPRLLQAECARTFKPIYDKLITPIVKLSYMGYSNSDNDQLAREQAELRRNSNVKYWYKIMQVCESLVYIHFVEDPSLESGANQMVSISKSEAESLEKARPPKPIEIVLAKSGQSIRQPIKFEPEINQLDDEFLLASIESIQTQVLVKRINLSSSVHQEISKKFVRKALQMLRKEWRQRKFMYSRPVQSAATKANLKQSTSLDTELTELIDMHLVSTRVEEYERYIAVSARQPAVELDQPKKKFWSLIRSHAIEPLRVLVKSALAAVMMLTDAIKRTFAPIFDRPHQATQLNGAK